MPLRLTNVGAICALAPLLWGQSQSEPAQVTAVRSWSFAELTRVAIETSGPCEFKAGHVHDPERLYLDIAPSRPAISQARTQVGDTRLRQIRVAETVKGVTRVVFDLAGGVDYRITTLDSPYRIVVEIQLRSATGAPHALSVDHTSTSEKTAPAQDARSAQFSPQVLSQPAPQTVRMNIPASAGSAEPVASSHPSPFRSAPVLSLLPERRETPITPLLKFVYPPEPPVREIAFPGNAPELDVGDTATASASLSRLLESNPLIVNPLPPAPATRDDASRNVRMSLTRALGLKISRVVIDPGHGGPDQGAVGPHGVREKDVVLDIALRLADITRTRLGAEVVLTRQDDVLIALQARTAVANESKADLFISIHANSSPYPAVAGTETYFLNLTSSPGAPELAARENADSSKTVGELKDVLRSITLNDKIEESSILAREIEKTMAEQSVHANTRARDRGVKRAPFVVLIGASMPSILAEVGFLTNSRDEANLGKADYRQKLAEAIYRGIEQYNRSLTHYAVTGKSVVLAAKESSAPDKSAVGR
jgi:N-acetylmuramoyl-L-alanine amidase